MILQKTPVMMAEARDIVSKLEEGEGLKEYFKKFTKLSKDKAEKLKKELESLNNLKLREEHFIKIVDFLPKDAEELNKIFPDVGLTEEETNAILETTRKY